MCCLATESSIAALLFHLVSLSCTTACGRLSVLPDMKSGAFFPQMYALGQCLGHAWHRVAMSGSSAQLSRWDPDHKFSGEMPIAKSSWLIWSWMLTAVFLKV